MKKVLLTFLFHFLIINYINATEQQPDILFYNDEKLTIDIGWGHPSPLQTFYQQNNLEYPFKMLHTANYRGHIATWKIEDNQFFITGITIENNKYLPEKFNITSINNSFSKKNQVFADWFTGVLVCKKRNQKKYWKTEYSLYIYVKNGIIQKNEKITKENFEEIQNITHKDSSDTNLMNKYSILHLNQSYISYYFRLYDKENIEIENRVGFLQGKKGFSIVLEKYQNSHFDWPYNWENIKLNGAPNGTWAVIDNKLFITELHLNTGLSFETPEKIPIKLSDVFPDKTDDNNKVFADWANGIYIVAFGQEVTDELMPELKRFKEEEYTLMRIKSGNIIEKYTIPSDFNFEKIPENTNSSLKKLILDFKKQRK